MILKKLGTLFAEMGTNSSCAFLAGFYVLVGEADLSVCKLQCELVITTALFVHVAVVRAKPNLPLVVG